MNLDLDLLTSHLYILKRMQRRLIREHGSKLTGKVLDIGCGKKPYRKFLVNVKRYVGMDSDRAVNPDIVCVIEKIKAGDGEFDSILCSEVLEHVREPLKALKEVNRVLKKRGILYLTVPMSWCLHYEPKDYYRYTPYSIKYLLEKSGFKVLKLVRIGGFFSLSAQRTIDVAYFSFLRLHIPKFVIISLLAPISLSAYYLSLLFDKIDKRDALGWAVLAEKR